jgi:hypothetical protein
MTITSEKLLNRPSELHRRYGGRLAMQKALQEKMVSGGPSNVVLTKKSIKNIEGIKVNVIKIENILKGTLSAEKKSLDDKKRLESGKRREKQEEKLETKPQAEKGKIKTPQIPRMGFLDWVKNFIGNVILGYFAVRMLDYLPKLIPIVKFLGSATDFVINTGGKLLDGLITFVDWGYKAIDATSGFIEKIGGSGAADNFGKFLGLIDNALFLTTTIAGAMAVEALTSDSGGPGPGGRRGGPGPGGRRGGGYRNGVRTGQYNGFNTRTTRSGNLLSRTGDALRAQRGDYSTSGYIKSEKDIMKRYFQRYGRDAFVQRFGQEGLEALPGGMARSGVTKFARNAFVGLAGKGGAKVILGTVRPLLKRLPIIGALIDFGLSVALGESPGRAAFKAIGAGLLGSVGAAIGSVVPIAGNIVGGIVGGMAGDAIGGALYDMFFGNKKPQQKNQPIQKKAGGGITRGGKAQTGARRTIGEDKKKGKYKRALARKPSKTQFKGDPKDPLVKTGQELDKTKYFGPVLAVSTKLEAKEEPTQKDYDNVGLGLNLLIAKGLEEGQLKGGLVAAFAGGGMVDDEFLEAAEKGVDVSSWISKTFRTEFETNAQKTLRQIKERKEKKDGAAGVPGAGTPGSPDMINIQGGDVDFWTLVAVASREDGEPQAWSDVAQSIYNRLASGAYTGKTIKDLILGQMQYEPTWKFPKPGVTGKPNQEWYAIKDAASAGIAAGQSEGAMKKVAAAILDPTLQKNAREFIQGRTDFRGYSVSGGVQRKAGDNYYGWYNNYRANKVGSVPNFGATATSTGAGPGGGTFVGGGTGSGYGTGGVKITGDLGDYMKANKGKIGVTGEIHQHPRHPGQKRRNYFSYHNQNRALDIGGWGPAHASSGGRDEQAPVIRALLEWNKKNGYQPVEIIHGSPAFKGLGKYESAPNALHSNHVHVAYALGGRVRKPTYAVVGDKGPEFIFDADTTAGLDRLAPGILEKLNVAKTKPQLASILQSYATYEQPYGDTQIVEVPVEVPVSVGGDSYESSSSPMVFSGNRDNPFDTLYQGG